MPNKKGQIQKGEHFSPSTQFKKGHKTWNKGSNIQTNTGRTHFKKGHTPANKGTGLYLTCTVCGKEYYSWRRNNRAFKYCSKKCQGIGMSGDNHWNWIGDDVGYAGIHDWIESVKGKPSKCEQCGKTKAKRFEWHNISHEYLRDENDWVRLCSICHAHQHKNWEKRWHSVVA